MMMHTSSHILVKKAICSALKNSQITLKSARKDLTDGEVALIFESLWQGQLSALTCERKWKSAFTAATAAANI